MGHIVCSRSGHLQCAQVGGIRRAEDRIARDDQVMARASYAIQCHAGAGKRRVRTQRHRAGVGLLASGAHRIGVGCKGGGAAYAQACQGGTLAHRFNRTGAITECCIAADGQGIGLRRHAVHCAMEAHRASRQAGAVRLVVLADAHIAVIGLRAGASFDTAGLEGGSTRHSQTCEPAQAVSAYAVAQVHRGGTESQGLAVAANAAVDRYRARCAQVHVVVQGDQAAIGLVARASCHVCSQAGGARNHQRFQWRECANRACEHAVAGNIQGLRTRSSAFHRAAEGRIGCA